MKREVPHGVHRAIVAGRACSMMRCSFQKRRGKKEVSSARYLFSVSWSLPCFRCSPLLRLLVPPFTLHVENMKGVVGSELESEKVVVAVAVEEEEEDDDDDRCSL